MKVRDAVLLYQETQTSDKNTKPIALDLVDPVSALCFEFEATNGTTNNQNNPLTRAITKLEVVDGSDVLASMSFEQAQALQFYKTGKQPQLREDEGPSAASVIGCMILFGRYLWDREYALDLTKFKNPQLKISWDLTNIRAVQAETAWGTGTTKISAWAKVMEGESPPGKYLMPKEIESWTGASSGDKRHELPTDYIYRMLMLRSYLTQCDVDENISKIKLTCDTDKFIPFERYTKQFDAEMAQLFGNVVCWKRYHATHNDTIWLPVNKEPQARFTIPSGSLMGYMVQYGWMWSGEAALLVADASGSGYGTDARIDAMIEGHALHATLPIPLGVMNEPDTWFDPTSYKKLELVLTEGGAAADSIVAEQVRPN
jgi:hypothetical protein